MKNGAVNPNLSRSRALVLFEYILLAVCLCVIALRATFAQGPGAQASGMSIDLSDSVYSLTISAVLIFSFVLWFVLAGCQRVFSYRMGTMETGLFVFLVSAVAAGIAAANKRAAITDFVTLLSPILMAVLLVQILDSRSKIRLVLAVIAALGIVSAYQCSEQFFGIIRMMIEQYEKAPRAMLEPLGIQEGTFAHMLFEHRLYSRDISGFFMNSNSAGSFAMLASFSGIALFIAGFKNRTKDSSGVVRVIAGGAAPVIIILGLALTQSKGAITASLIAGVMFVMYLCFGDWLGKHKRAILVVCLLLAVSGGCVVVWYGTAHGWLPGGNSMLVRWQYWASTVKMYADHRLVGVGPGNFAWFYPHYKPAAALESVSDPHNFPLALLAGYGPLGLVGFLAMIFVPLWTVVFPKPVSASVGIERSPVTLIKLAAPFAVVISVALLVVRPMLLPVAAGATPEEKGSAEIILYVMPVVVFVIGFLLLTVSLYGKGNTQHKTWNTNITMAALFCACSGCLIHSLIDFAIFEPGVFTAFCAVIACVVASGHCENRRKVLVVKPRLFIKLLSIAGALIIIWGYFIFALVPVIKSSAAIRQGHQLSRRGQFEQAHKHLATAAKVDVLSPAASSLNARLYLRRSDPGGSEQKGLLVAAERNLLEAVERNSADFKNFERLSKVHVLLAEISTSQEKDNYLSKAYDSAQQGVERYPGCARLRIESAKVAERLGKTDIAIEQYRKAIEIEDAYRSQFRIMYPGREMFSRLGQGKYDLAKQKIETLR